MANTPNFALAKKAGWKVKWREVLALVGSSIILPRFFAYFFINEKSMKHQARLKKEGTIHRVGLFNASLFILNPYLEEIQIQIKIMFNLIV